MLDRSCLDASHVRARVLRIFFQPKQGRIAQFETYTLLYLQTQGSSLAAAVHGMALVQDGEIREGPANVEEWPYRSPLEAIRDGWRVIQFPNMALMLDESHTYGLGCEFILERWG